MDEENTYMPLWSATPVCSCTGDGKPVDFGGEKVIFRSPSCRVHVIQLSFSHQPLSAERLVSTWVGREKVDDANGE